MFTKNIIMIIIQTKTNENKQTKTNKNKQKQTKTNKNKQKQTKTKIEQMNQNRIKTCNWKFEQRQERL